MPLKNELEVYVQKVLDEQWQRRSGQKVPDTDDVALKNEAVELDATVLYADLAGSTKMVKGALHNPGCSWGLNPPVSRRLRAM